MCEDVFVNPDVSEIAQKLDGQPPDVHMFTNGEYIRTPQIHETPGNVIYPLDWEHPFTAEIVGQGNYNSKMDFALQYTGADVWQTYLGDNLKQLYQTAQQMAQHGIDWECHLSEHEPPEELIEFCQENDFRIVPLSQWYFIHEDRYVPDPFREEVLRENRSYSGAIYIDKGGMVHSICSDYVKPIFGVDRGNIHNFSLSEDMVTS